jgi:flavin-dependent dehydrogenase
MPTLLGMMLIHHDQIGAGPSGMALALALLENGVKVRLIEKMPTTRIGSRGNGLQASLLCSFEAELETNAFCSRSRELSKLSSSWASSTKFFLKPQRRS